MAFTNLLALELLADVLDDGAGAAIDACTLNNALNVVQVVILVALLRWIRNGNSAD